MRSDAVCIKILINACIPEIDGFQLKEPPQKMFPLKDDVTTEIKPIITWLIILVNVVVFCFEVLANVAEQPAFVEGWALVPARFLSHFSTMQASTVVTSMFLHGDIVHIAGNMLFLFVFGHSVEDRLGHLRYLFLYLFLGIAAALAQVLMDPGSDIPMIGASGAISGVLGLYIIFFPTARILTFIPMGILSRLVYVPAVAFLFIWFVLQLGGALMSAVGKTGSAEEAGVAFGAHIGGFLAGILVAKSASGCQSRCTDTEGSSGLGI